ncbi:MAG: Mur ligase domain-containing protein, partial [Wenzhouxiangella sp.]|nr:Mur ligase domain-containing protein [Wenzhouxiangella sp.]
MRLMLRDIAAVTTGQLQGPDVEVRGLCHDSRQIRSGDLFVALSGEHSDGHEFARQAVDAGASAVLAERALDDDIAHVQVEDTQQAMGQIAAHWRKQLDGLKVVGITGSNGKTTVKEMTAAVLSVAGPTAATPG